MFQPSFRSLLSIIALLLVTMLGSVVMTTAAQPLETEEFSLTVDTAFCEPGYFGPFDGCTPWDGVTVSVLYETPGGTVSDACVTVAGDRTATCTVNVPFGATVTALINPAMIPDGYVLEGSTEVQVTIPDGPPEGLFGGAAFVLFPAAAPQEDPPAQEPITPQGGFPLSAATAFCEPGYAGPFVGCGPWEGVTVFFASADGSFSASCVTSGAVRAAGCTVEVPFGATITASIDPAAIPAGYVLERSTSLEFQIPDGPPEGEFGPAAFVLLPAPAEETTTTDTSEAVTEQDTTTAVAPVAQDTDTASPADTEAVESPGLPVAIYAATCDEPLPTEAVAGLGDARGATGENVGVADAVPVATSYTEVNIPFDTVLNGDHMLAIFAEGDADTLVACGSLGGALDSNGALAVGLLPVDDSGHTAIAYLSPLDDGARTAISIFVTLPPEPE